jgi:hypothetical protein
MANNYKLNSIIPRLLPHDIPPVNHQIRARRIRARIADQIHIRALELLRIAIAAQRDHGVPQVLRLLRHKVRQPRVDVARRDGVDSRKVAPLVRQRVRHVYAPGLGHVVRRLLLREVGDVARHAGRDDEAALAALLEVRADGFGAVERAVEVGLDDLVPVLDRAVQDARVGGAAGVRDEPVDVAKVADHVGDQLLDLRPLRDVAFVRLGLHPVLGRQFLRVLLAAFGPRRVGEGDVGAHLGAAARGLDAHAARAGGAGDHDDFAFEAEEVGEGVGGGDGDGHDVAVDDVVVQLMMWWFS